MSRHLDSPRSSVPDLTTASLMMPSQHPVNLAFAAGIAKFQAPTRRVGQRQGTTERSVRDGDTAPANPLCVVLAAGQLRGAPLFGANGAMQILERAKFALRQAYGQLPTLDVDTASMAETIAQAAVDCLQVKRWDRMNAGELQDFAAHAEQHAAALVDLALAARRAAHEKEQNERGARAQLAGFAR